MHIGDRFGYRDCAGCSTNHHGQDFNPGLGAEIQSIADGTVAVSTDSGGSLGVVTMIDHVIDGEVITSVYAHMEYDSRRFEVGDTVKVGDVIGTTGNTGMSTGPHLHFEIRIGGIDGTKGRPARVALRQHELADAAAARRPSSPRGAAACRVRAHCVPRRAPGIQRRRLALA